MKTFCERSTTKYRKQATAAKTSWLKAKNCGIKSAIGLCCIDLKSTMQSLESLEYKKRLNS